MLQTILHWICKQMTSDSVSFLIALCIVLYLFLLTILHFRDIKHGKSAKLLPIFYCLPSLCIPLELAATYYHGNFGKWFSVYHGFLAACFFCGLIPLLWHGKKLDRIGTAAGFLAVTGCFYYFCFWTNSDQFVTANFSGQSRTESFLSLTAEMERNYALSEWKQIDYPALREKYLPLIEKADQTNDDTAYLDALYQYITEFHDGHVNIFNGRSESLRTYFDYLSDSTDIPIHFGAMRLSTGEYAAVCSENALTPRMKKLGLRSGTILTRWNDMPIADAAAQIKLSPPAAGDLGLLENEEFIKPLYLSQTAAFTTKIGFLDANGIERNLRICDLFECNEFQEDAESAFSSYLMTNVTNQYLSDEEQCVAMLSDCCGYLCINHESESFPKLREELERLAANGMTKLILDLRNNEGGKLLVGAEIASLFSPEKKLLAEIDGETYEITGECISDSLEIAVLVGTGCISCGEEIAYALAPYENITTMGLTPTNGASQPIGGKVLLSNSDFVVCYSIYQNLQPDGTPKIDCGAARATRFAPEVRIPLTKEALEQIDQRGEDYALFYAFEYLGEDLNKYRQQKELDERMEFIRWEQEFTAYTNEPDTE